MPKLSPAVAAAITSIVVGIYTAVFLAYPQLIIKSIMGLGGLVLISSCLIFLYLAADFVIDEYRYQRSKRRSR